MPVPSGFTAIYTGIVEGNEENYTLIISQRDTILPLPDVETVTFHEELTWKFGSLIGGTIEKGLMPGHTQTQLLDPATLRFLHLSNRRLAGAEDKDFHLNISGGDLDVGCFIRLNSLNTLEAHWVEVPALAIQSTDGMGILDKVQKGGIFAAGTSLLGMAQDALYTSLQQITPLIWRYDFGASNTPATQYLHSMISLTASGDYARDREFQKRIQVIYELMNVRVWQGFDGAWHLEQPHLMGQAGTQYVDPVFGVVTEEAVAENVVVLQQGDFEGGLRKRLRDPITTVEIERIWKDRQITVAGVEVPLICSMLRGGGFNNIHNKALQHWEAVGSGGGGVLDARGRVDTCLLLAPDEANEQKGAWISAGEDIPLMLHGWFALESTGGGGASKSAHLRIEWQPWNTVADSTLYLNSDGHWQGASTTIATPTQTTQANGAGTLTWHEWWITITEKAPTTGRVVVILLGAAEAGDAGYNTAWDDLMLSPVSPETDDGTGKPARVQSLTLKTKLYAFDGTTGLALQGETVKLEHQIPHCSYIFEANAGATPGGFIFEFLEFQFFDGTDTPNRFQVQFFTYDGNSYVDPVEMIWAYMQDLAGQGSWELYGSVNRLAAPERPLRNLDGTDYFMVRGSAALNEGTTEGVWVQNLLPPAEE